MGLRGPGICGMAAWYSLVGTFVLLRCIVFFLGGGTDELQHCLGEVIHMTKKLS